MYNNYNKNAKVAVKRDTKRGKKGEDNFSKVMESNGFEVQGTTTKENILEHKDRRIIDHLGIISPLKETFTVDVKIKRKNWKEDTCHALEFGKQGFPGWSIAKILPDMFAFETKDGSFLLIWSEVVRAEAKKVMSELKDRGDRMIQDAKRYTEVNEYRVYLFQEYNDEGRNYYCHISNQDAIRMSFMEIKLKENIDD